MPNRDYDFSKAIRGKFYRRKAKLNLPIYLDRESLAFVQKIATEKRTDLSTVVNELIHGGKRLAAILK